MSREADASRPLRAVPLLSFSTSQTFAKEHHIVLTYTRALYLQPRPQTIYASPCSGHHHNFWLIYRSADQLNDKRQFCTDANSVEHIHESNVGYNGPLRLLYMQHGCLITNYRVIIRKKRRILIIMPPNRRRHPLFVYILKCITRSPSEGQ